MEFKIGAVSKMTGLSPSGIRFLEEQGLLSPSGGRKGRAFRTSMSPARTRICGACLTTRAAAHLASAMLPACLPVRQRQRMP